MAKQEEGGGYNRPRLALHVPEPKFRPGDTVDFSHIPIPEAGAAEDRSADHTAYYTDS